MFTGIVEEMGRVMEATPTRLVIQAHVTLDGTRVADSIAVNGACLTVVDIQGDTLAVDVVPETLRRTNLGDARPGDLVNLERSLALGDRMGGHMVQGHVEATARVISLEPEGEAVNIGFHAPPEIMRYVVPKGFIAVDGISLTVVQYNPSSFTVTVIPYTREQTVLGSRRVGDRVNLETDVIARYVERLVKGEGSS
ncbi:riboflavin synthase [Chloroflexota bacterium]